MTRTPNVALHCAGQLPGDIAREVSIAVVRSIDLKFAYVNQAGLFRGLSLSEYLLER